MNGVLENPKETQPVVVEVIVASRTELSHTEKLAEKLLLGVKVWVGVQVLLAVAGAAENSNSAEESPKSGNDSFMLFP
jgi:hypothetical protein